MDIEKYKNDLLDREIRRMAREEGTGWRDIVGLFSLFPITFIGVWIFAPVANHLVENNANVWIILASLLFCVFIIMLLWIPIFVWSLKSQSKKMEIAYNRLRNEYGLDLKEN